MAKAIPGSWVNMIALGLSGTLAGLPLQALQDAVRESWKKPDTLEANLAAVLAGAQAAADITAGLLDRGGAMAHLQPSALSAKPRWMISGNEAAGFGAIQGGVRFCAAYPITPQTSVVETLSEWVESGELAAEFVTVESEHSALTVCITASTVGARVFTATSANGLAYMTEQVWWAAGARLRGLARGKGPTGSGLGRRAGDRTEAMR